jgi:hypothetical protein
MMVLISPMLTSLFLSDAGTGAKGVDGDRLRRPEKSRWLNRSAVTHA